MEEVNELVGVINCTFKGMELAGHFGKEGIKGFIKVITFLWNSSEVLGSFVWSKKEQHRITKSGKISRKTMREKYGDAIIYKDMKIVAKEVYDNEIGNGRSKLSREALRKFRPTEKSQLAHWEKTAKKHGLNYIRFPKPEGGFILQVPKDQEALFEEVYKQHCAWIKEEAKSYYKEIAQDMREAKVTESDVYESMTEKSKEVINNPYPSLSRDDVLSVIANLTDGDYTNGMEEAFPGYNATAPFDGKTIAEIVAEVKQSNMLSDGKKKEIIQALDEYEQKRAQEKGAVKEFVVNKRNMKVREENGKIFITFQHPMHPNVRVTVEAKNLCGRVKWDGYQAHFCVRKDSEVKASVQKMVVSDKVRTIKVYNHSCGLDELERKIRSDAEKAKKKAARGRVGVKSTVKPKVRLG